MIGHGSHKLFSILKLDTTFFDLPVNNWEDSISYKERKEVVGLLVVVNDAAERGVKVGSDYLTLTKIEEKYPPSCRKPS